MVLLMKLLAAAVVGGGVVAGGAGVAMTVNGTPAHCADRFVYSSPVDVAIARSKWEVFKIQVAHGLATVEFTEAEATALGARVLEGKVENFQVLFCPQGYAEATGTAKGIDFLIKADVDLRGSMPRAKIIGVQTGNLPRSIPVASLIPRIEDEVPYFDPGVKIISIRYNRPIPGVVQITGVSK
jgi:hypothetical protein